MARFRLAERAHAPREPVTEADLTYLIGDGPLPLTMLEPNGEAFGIGHLDKSAVIEQISREYGEPLDLTEADVEHTYALADCNRGDLADWYVIWRSIFRIYPRGFAVTVVQL